MSPFIVAGLSFIALICLLAAGMPIAFAAASVGLVGFLFIGGWPTVWMYLGGVPYSEVASYTFSVLPLFILMGQFFAKAGFASSIFRAGRDWTGKLPGGLAIGTVLGGAAFGACCGVSTAAAAVLGKICIPELEKHKFSSPLVAGTVAASSNLSSMIPPSGLMVVYCMMTEVSLGRLLMAGVFPGLLIASVFAMYLYIFARLKPTSAPSIDEAVSWKRRFVSLGRAWPALIMALTVLGGIYSGVFTPTEAGAAGSFLSLCLWAGTRKISLNGVAESLLDAGKTTAMIFILIVGVMLFSRFLALARVPITLAAFVSQLHVSPLGILCPMLLSYMLLGCFVDPVGMLILTLPVFFPIIISLGYDPIWFGIIVVIMIEIGMLTPPVGINCYVVHGIAPNISLEDVFRGTAPFVVLNLIVIAILIAFPQIALFLPGP